MNAQIHEIGIFVGGSNYIGDVGSTTYIAPNEFATGLLYKWNKNPRIAYRFSFMNSNYSGFDNKSDEPSRNNRGYNFTNNIKEASVGIEFNFFNFNLHNGRRKITPYIHSGINYLIHNDAYLDISSGNLVVLDKKIGSVAIPITLGIKSNITPHWILAFEVGSRYALTDHLDGNNPKDAVLNKFGNINNNDWYIFSGFTLTYTFGSKPCYCTQ